ncbi:lysine--tRNA ligase [candidate division WWE3 bacterium CG_4_9_14_3_um_filter_41_6]|uniref:Lysine--tRNA ligase n=1 Tax=candidate division WWE3 bacterium CG_4_10_14_0_2_um_filter_41_14 TaxID=1975072 RepID=A0A2M7TK35_UNCKA|nr:MAG: lysine--tRNA ligase [candidate division WWE3 bacterium CG_4_10_14_0_2_um_filter_41_14]PJA38833.1 MAG: lysine--tRNA ligase [candidate division WWE3 bacterium CG_4_9_14_3_um_filter_41_6]
MQQSKKPIELIREEKLKKIEKLKELNVNPYPSVLTFDVDSISQAREQKEGATVSVAGRITSVRGHGGIRFFDIKNESGHIQAACKADVVSEKNQEIINLVDAGDFIEVTGQLFTTKTGELTINTTDLHLLSKAIRPLPDEHEGLVDKEIRFRKRYLDLLINPSTRAIFDTRHALIKGIRSFLDQKGLTEVETPVLQPLYGGANAKPFITHIHALDTNAYLRIASELYLKRLVVGGIEGVYDIAKDFRNEGVDQTHFPEFTMLEAYIPYADYHNMMDTMEELVRFLATSVVKQTTVTVHETQVDLSGEWRRVAMTDLILEYLSFDVTTKTHEQLITYANDQKIDFLPSTGTGELIFLIFDKLVSHKLINPTWVIDYPIEVSPLSKNHRSKPGFTERFELYIGGVELMDGWSEVNDSIEQRTRFEEESKRNLSETESAQPLDEDFLEALEYGAPPFAGVGIGLDRLTMFFTNTWSIQETILFPFKKQQST